MRAIKKSNIEAGFSVLEVILAAAIFVIFSTSAVIVVIQGYNANRQGNEFTVANQFAAEGIEAVKSVKNQNYSSLINSASLGLRRNGSNVWELFGTENRLSHNNNPADDYIRKIKIEDVYRDVNGNIVANGGTTDPDTKKITSTVTWNFNFSRPETLDLVTYLSDWRKPINNGGPIMMAYSKTTSTPFYRVWDGSSWSAEAPAQIVGGNINYVVLKSSRTRNEAILGTLDSNGNIYVQVWDGSNWGTPELMASLGSARAAYRSFDIEYEKNGDRAVLIYPQFSSSVDPAYRIWDGTNWSSIINITAPPTTGVIRWIEIAQNPISGSNEISMIMQDANASVYGMVWDGLSWNNMGVSGVWDNSTATANRKTIDVAYEQNSGRAMFIWGDSVSRNQYYRIWDGFSLNGPIVLTISTSGGAANWIELVPRPDSNELMYGVVDAGADLNTRKWSGSGWDTHPEHSAGVENITSMAFDIIWETHPANPGKAWLLWGNGTRVSAKPWSGTAWGSATVLSGSDDTSFIKLKADPDSGAIFAGIYESVASATDDIWESRLTTGGTTWSAKNTLWGGPISTEPVYFRIDIATP